MENQETVQTVADRVKDLLRLWSAYETKEKAFDIFQREKQKHLDELRTECHREKERLTVGIDRFYKEVKGVGRSIPAEKALTHIILTYTTVDEAGKIVFLEKTEEANETR